MQQPVLGESGGKLNTTPLFVRNEVLGMLQTGRPTCPMNSITACINPYIMNKYTILQNYTSIGMQSDCYFGRH